MKAVKKKTKVEKPKEEATEKKTSPFDYINCILKSKKDIIRDSENPELMEKGYVPFFTNKALSFHIDAILYANEMNKRGQLDHILQFDYLINTIRSMNRNHTWIKKTPNDEIKIIQEYYDVNPVKAQDIFKIIGKEGVEKIQKLLIKGGIVK